MQMAIILKEGQTAEATTQLLRSHIHHLLRIIRHPTHPLHLLLLHRLPPPCRHPSSPPHGQLNLSLVVSPYPGVVMEASCCRNVRRLPVGLQRRIFGSGHTAHQETEQLASVEQLHPEGSISLAATMMARLR